MYACPINDAFAFAIDDEDTEAWRFYYVDFDPLRVDSFEAPYGGVIASATMNPASQAVWMLARGQLYASSRELRIAVPLPLPEEGIVPFDVKLMGGRYYVAANAASVWYFDPPTESWVSVKQPEARDPSPPREPGESYEDYASRQNAAMVAFALDNPDYYKLFQVGEDHYFVGALGQVTRLRSGALTEFEVDSGARLIDGHAEGTNVILCGDNPVAEVFQGSLEGGFERIYENQNGALHKTAMHGGIRYIGAAQDPEYEGDALFTWDGAELTPVETGCEREPRSLLQLASTGNVLWAIDEAGFFRLTPYGWELIEFTDMQTDAQP